MQDETDEKMRDYAVMRFFVKKYISRNGTVKSLRYEIRHAKIKLLLSFFFAYLLVFRVIIGSWLWTVGGAIIATIAFTSMIWSFGRHYTKVDESRQESDDPETNSWVWESLPIEFMRVEEYHGKARVGDVAEAKSVLYEKRMLDYIEAVYPAAFGFSFFVFIIVCLSRA